MSCGMNYKERVNHMLTKLKHMVKGVADSGYTSITYCIGEIGEKHYKENVCRTCFRNAYNIGNTALTDIISKIKCGAKAYTVPFGHAMPPLDSAIVKGIISMGARKGIKLTHSQIGNIIYINIFGLSQNVLRYVTGTQLAGEYSLLCLDANLL